MKDYWTILRGHPRPMRFLAARLLMAARVSHLLVIPRNGYRLRFHRANVAAQRWIDPGGRNEAEEFIEAYLEPGDRVVDVGANIGETALAASIRVGAAGDVVAIEAHPRTAAFLRDNVALNAATNVRVVDRAVGAARGTVRISDDRRDDMNRVGSGGLEVAVETLDALAPDSRPIALLKVDVEGYEKFVLEGGARTLARTRCVFVEVSAPHFRRFGHETRAVLELLARAGFRLYRIAGRALHAIGTDYDTESVENVVALRDEPDFARRAGWTID